MTLDPLHLLCCRPLTYCYGADTCCTYTPLLLLSCVAGWTGFLDLVLGHYGIEVEEENILLFVGIVPIAIDVLFKYWIFIGELMAEHCGVAGRL